RGACSCGPGNGKTGPVVGLPGLRAGLTADGRVQVALAAPTGKAAARLEEAVRTGRGLLPAALRDAIPERASTVHRLVGVHRDSPRVTYGPERTLAADVVVVDEASMVDLALMAKLLRALKAEARLVLLGAKDHLAWVEAGAVLGDIGGDAPGFSPAFAVRVGGIVGEVVPAGSGSGDSPLRDGVVLLRHSRRFAAESGIARLAAAVNR